MPTFRIWYVGTEDFANRGGEIGARGLSKDWAEFRRMRSSANSRRKYRAGNAKRLSARRNLAECSATMNRITRHEHDFNLFGSNPCSLQRYGDSSPFTVRHSRSF